MSIGKKQRMYEQIGKHITQLLYTQECVVVPAFGAFITQYEAANLLAASHRFVPPSHTLAFNAALTHNDGLLLNWIVQHEGISYAAAAQKIQTFVQYWQQDLMQQGIISLTGIGRFIADSEGRVRFLPEARNYNLDTFGMPTFVLPPVIATAKTWEPAQLAKSALDTTAAAPVRPYKKWKLRATHWQNAAIAAALIAVVAWGAWLVQDSLRYHPTKTTHTTATLRRTKISEASMIPILPTAPPIVAPTEVAPLAKAETIKVVVKAQKTKRLTATPILAKPAQPVRVFTIALGSYKNPENVAALLQHAKQQGDAVQTIEKTKGLTTVVMRVQLRESELPTKLAQIGNAYNTKPVVLAH